MAARLIHLLKYLWPTILIFGLSFCLALVVFLWPAPSGQDPALRAYQDVVDTLPGPFPPTIILTFTASWCIGCHQQLKQAKSLWPHHDFGRGEQQWWALNIDGATAASLQRFWQEQRLSLKLLLPDAIIQAALAKIVHWEIPLHLLVEQQKVQRILSKNEVEAFWQQHLKDFPAGQIRD